MTLSNWNQPFCLSIYIFKDLAVHLIKKSVSSCKNDIKEEKVWLCSQFQRNKCSHKGTYLVVVKGKMRQAQHTCICAACWQKGKAKLADPKSLSSCPHASL